MLIILLILATISFVIIISLLILMVDSLLWRHDLPTSHKAIKNIATIIQSHHPRAKKFIDLGSGRGTLAIGVKKALPYLEVQGIDNSRVRVVISTLKARLMRQQVHFTKGDIFNTNVGNADIIYTYLWYDHMPKLEEKLKNELPDNAIVITNTSHFPHWPTEQIYITHPHAPRFEELFVYKKI